MTTVIIVALIVEALALLWLGARYSTGVLLTARAAKIIVATACGWAAAAVSWVWRAKTPL
jgi:hypothetical protein